LDTATCAQCDSSEWIGKTWSKRAPATSIAWRQFPNESSPPGAATAFLALDAARLITGDTLYVDGGYHIVD